MTAGRLLPSEAVTFRDAETDAPVRRITNAPCIHHHPFFFVPAYDDLEERLIFISHRTGRPEIFAELRQEPGRPLLQISHLEGLAEWSVHPSHDGRHVYFTDEQQRGWRIELATLRQECLFELGGSASKAEGMVGSAMGTTALTRDDRWWAISYRRGNAAELAVIDTVTGDKQMILRAPSIGHMQFCPDDPEVLFYAGPMTDRVWLINRDGSNNRRLYQRDAGAQEWITHETWLPSRRELALVDWPHGIKAVHMDTGAVRHVTRSFNAWHAAASRQGDCMVADTAFPDTGLKIFDPRDGTGAPQPLCQSRASSEGAHWAGPFPYDNGPVKVYAPQHTHPHPSFSPSGRSVVYTSDRDGHAQIYEVELAGLG